MIDDIPIGAGLNRNLGSPTAPGEAVGAELGRLIERRSRQKDPDEESELWKARYAKTGNGIVPRLSTSTAPRYEG